MSSAFTITDQPTQRREDVREPLGVAAPSSDEHSAAVAAAFRAGDESAARVLTEHLLPLVTRLVHRLSAWSGDGDDLVQDVLVTALAKRKTFNGNARLETWITRIAINRCRAHARKAWLRRRLFRAWAERQQASPPVSPSSDLIAEQSERARLVRTAVAELPQLAREAIVLCYLEGLSVGEAAEVLGVRRGTLEVRLTRARNVLRVSLGGKLGECLPTELTECESSQHAK